MVNVRKTTMITDELYKSSHELEFLKIWIKKCCGYLWSKQVASYHEHSLFPSKTDRERNT